MATGDLTDLATVKALIGIASTDSDSALSNLIAAMSGLICNYCGRSTFASAPYTDFYDGNGKNWLLLREWPVTAVSSITLADGAVVNTQASGLASGYLLEPVIPQGGNQRLTLFGYQFARGRSNIQITYTAGYASTPPAVQQACNELVNEAFARKDRPGQASKSMGGAETVSFSQADMNAAIKAMLASYRHNIPV